MTENRTSAVFDFPKSKISHVRFSKMEHRPCSIFQNGTSAMFDFPNRKSAMSEDRHPKTGTRKTGTRKTGIRKTGTRKTDSCIYFRKTIPGELISESAFWKPILRNQLRKFYIAKGKAEPSCGNYKHRWSCHTTLISSSFNHQSWQLASEH